jgi:hypothetical protein
MNARGQYIKSPARQTVGDGYLQISKVDQDVLMFGEEQDSVQDKGDVSFGGKNKPD